MFVTFRDIGFSPLFVLRYIITAIITNGQPVVTFLSPGVSDNIIFIIDKMCFGLFASRVYLTQTTIGQSRSRTVQN